MTLTLKDIEELERQANDPAPGWNLMEITPETVLALLALAKSAISPPVPEDRAGLVEREAVARIIDREVWARIDQLRHDPDYPEPDQLQWDIDRRAAPSLAKADAILLSLAGGERWRPITTDPVHGVAPWDGRPVLILTDNQWGDPRAMARWSDDFHGDGVPSWLVDDNKHGPYLLRGFLNVTHWLPLPSPPRSEKP